MTGKSQIAPAGAHPRQTAPGLPRLGSESRDEQEALHLLRQFRLRRPLRHGAPLASTVQDLIDEWQRGG